MRLNILFLALLSSAGFAHAGSIDTIATGKDKVRSVETIRCVTCVTKQPKKTESVVELAPGTQKIEIREVDGVRKIYRTEAWLGGSPVVFVSKMPPEAEPVVAEENRVTKDDLASSPETLSEQPPASAEADMIDEKATTSAVTADIGAEAKITPRPVFDANGLELRLN